MSIHNISEFQNWERADVGSIVNISYNDSTAETGVIESILYEDNGIIMRVHLGNNVYFTLNVEKKKDFTYQSDCVKYISVTDHDLRDSPEINRVNISYF